MKCKECPANNEGTCLIKRKSRMLVSGSYGCDAQKKNVEKRLGIYKQTNADRIRHMTDEEMADAIVEKFVIDDYCPPGFFFSEWACEGMGCVDCWLDWLKQEAKNDER